MMPDPTTTELAALVADGFTELRAAATTARPEVCMSRLVAVIDKLRAIKPPETDGWHTEEPPKTGWYMVTPAGEITSVCIWYWHDRAWWNSGKEIKHGVDVIAWRHLPEPYKSVWGESIAARAVRMVELARGAVVLTREQVGYISAAMLAWDSYDCRSGAEDERLAFWRAMKLLCGNRSTRRALGIEVDKCE